jgi:hypothetical protein
MIRARAVQPRNTNAVAPARDPSCKRRAGTVFSSKRLGEGDVLMVKRLARGTRDVLNIFDTVAKSGGGFKPLGDNRTG